MKFTDDGEVDDKIIVVPVDDRETGNAIKTLSDIPAATLKQIEFHFNHYKDLKKPGTTVVDHFGDIDEAKAVIKEAQKRWTEQ
ncbi:MAG: inorganic diphosphatase, partial [Candidatus Nomurabacteria bacterium]|jgi:inorganic pyrophosphatase|nr:inorganic diphosphatase [Candidatus Nomurabacteria bacterium]